MKVLYICTLLPATSGSGGKRAAFNHVLDIAGSAQAVDLVCVDVEASGARTIEGLPTNVHATIFSRAIGRAGAGFAGKLQAVRQLFTSRLPRSAAVVSSAEVRNYVATLLAANDYFCVFIEHLNSYAIVRNLALRAPLIYVAQNVEAVVLRDLRATFPVGSPSRYLTWIEYFKTGWFEREALARADQTVVIGKADFAYISAVAGPAKTRLWPELPLIKDSTWKFSGSRCLLFVGSAGYFPNRDALHWLVHELMPAIARIDPAIRLHVAGTDATVFAQSGNIIFEGFVSDARLEQLHFQCDLFLSPVVLGAGIKIKVLEAASYGVPIAATYESLQGIDFLGAPFVLQRDNQSMAQRVCELLVDQIALEAMSASNLAGLRAARAARGPLVEDSINAR